MTEGRVTTEFSRRLAERITIETNARYRCHAETREAKGQAAEFDDNEWSDLRATVVEEVIDVIFSLMDTNRVEEERKAEDMARDYAA